MLTWRSMTWVCAAQPARGRCLSPGATPPAAGSFHVLPLLSGGYCQHVQRISNAARGLRNAIPDTVVRLWVPVAWLVALTFTMVDVLAGADFLGLPPWTFPVLSFAVVFVTALDEWRHRRQVEDELKGVRQDLMTAEIALPKALEAQDQAARRMHEAVEERDKAKEALKALTDTHEISRLFRRLWEQGQPMRTRGVLDPEWVAEARAAIDRYCPTKSGEFAEKEDPDRPRPMYFGDGTDRAWTPKEIASALLDVVKAIADDPPH